MQDFLASHAIRVRMDIFITKTREMVVELGRAATPTELAHVLNIDIETVHVLQNRASLPIGTKVDSEWADALAKLPAPEARAFPDITGKDLLAGVDISALGKHIQKEIKKDE